jgi:hypothetical protein
VTLFSHPMKTAARQPNKQPPVTKSAASFEVSKGACALPAQLGSRAWLSSKLESQHRSGLALPRPLFSHIQSTITHSHAAFPTLSSLNIPSTSLLIPSISVDPDLSLSATAIP